MKLLSPEYWTDYELIDTGGFEKLERFGEFIISRPEPQALWKKSLPQSEWHRLVHAVFKRETGKDRAPETEKGEWVLKSGMPQRWWISYAYREMSLRFRLGLTSFKHVGIFPEQAGNWNFIYDCVREMQTGETRVLNLFAYTGGASLAAKAAGAEVVHVDSVKQVVNWSRENMEASGLSGIRWIVEDAMKYLRRELKRGKQYQGIILDPPAYGRGPNGEKWILEEGIGELMELSSKLLSPQNSFLVLNLYSMGFSALVAGNLAGSYFPDINIEYGELFVSDRMKRRLPLGIFARGKKTGK
ncbi:MAG: class I SAM-dependent methyltransferase [Prevotellaceae bacterium]|jgi:23S rRNA (cytosine1962-C5)-methyltransferase|nr:class I SAM-dependent methyltransferase [Prevotellaceae bacterium]